MLRMNLVVGVQIEATEPELAFLVGNVGCNVLGADVLQINDGGIHGGFLFVDNGAANRPQLGFTALALRKKRGRRKCHQHQESKPSGCIHGFPPASGSICNVKSSRFPPRASILRVRGLKPWASIISSDSPPGLALIPSSPPPSA